MSYRQRMPIMVSEELPTEDALLRAFFICNSSETSKDILHQELL
jgi:hypothetical protein